MRGRAHRGAAIAAESLLLLGLISGLNLIFFDNPAFLGVEPHPFYAAVLLITVRYGFVAGAGCAALASGVYFAQLVVGLDAPSWRDFLVFDYARPAVVMLSGAALLGLVADGHLRRLGDLEARLGATRRALADLEGEQARLRDVNAHLAERVTRADATLPALYRYARRLNVADEGAIYEGLVSVLRDAMRARRCSVYAVGAGGLSRVAGDGPDVSALAGPSLRRVMDGRVLTLRDLEGGGEGAPLFLAGPLREGPEGPVVAVLTVEEIDFERYNLAALRLFRVLVDWAAHSLAHARLSQASVLGDTGTMETLGGATVPADQFVALIHELGDYLGQETA